MRSDFQFASTKSQPGTTRQASQGCKVNEMKADTISESNVNLLVVKLR